MTEFEPTPFPADDARLVHLAIAESGWSADQVLLNKRNVEALRKLIRRPSLDGAEAVISRYLRRIFVNAVAAETMRQRPSQEGSESVLCASYPSVIRRDRKPKLGTIVREELRILKDHHRGASGSHGGDAAETFARLLAEANEATRRIIELVMLEHGTITASIETLYRAKPMSSDDFAALGHAIDGALVAVIAFIKPGAEEPALKQMARGLAQLYYYVTGERPRRSYRESGSAPEGQDCGELGDFLDLCRHMARLVNEALPSNLRRPQAADMAKIARNVMAELEKQKRVTG